MNQRSSLVTKIGNPLNILIFSILTTLFAQASVQVQATVNRDEISLQDTLQMTISVSSSDEVDSSGPDIESLKDFNVLQKSKSSAVSQKMFSTPSGMQFETVHRNDFHLILAPKKVGQLTIESIPVIVAGKSYRTDQIKIKVVEQSASAGRRGRIQVPDDEPFDPFQQMDEAEDEIFRQMLQQRKKMLQGVQPFGEDDLQNPGMANPAYRSQPNNNKEAFFIQVEVDKTTVYEGEQVTVNWYLYTRGQMETLDRLKFPSLRGFWKEIIEEVPALQFTQEVLNGVPYRKALLASHALFPIKAGQATLDEFKIRSRVRLPAGGGLFGGLGPAYEYTKSSMPVSIKVKPLPLDGRPSDFSDAVGQFGITAKVEGHQFIINQPISLKIRFEGKGNAKLIDLPKIDLSPGLEMYDSKSESKFFKNGQSYKEFDVLVIPRQTGEVTIPAMSFSMFDPQAGKYIAKTTQPISLKIEDNPNPQQNSGVRAQFDENKSTKNEIRKELELPRPMIMLAIPVVANLYQFEFWLIMLAFVLLIICVQAYLKLGQKQKRQSLRDLLNLKLKKAQQFASKEQSQQLGIEILNAYYLILGDIAGDGASIQMAQLMEKIPPSLRREYGQKISQNFEYFQTLAFAPIEVSQKLRTPEELKRQMDIMKEYVDLLVEHVQN